MVFVLVFVLAIFLAIRLVFPPSNQVSGNNSHIGVKREPAGMFCGCEVFLAHLS